MKKNILIAIGLLVFALGLASTTAWRIKKWQEGFDKNSFSQLEEIKIIPIEELKGEFKNIFSPNAGEGDYQEFISPNGNLKIEYPAGWLVIEEENILESIVLGDWAEKHNLKTLFLAQNLQGEEFGQIIIHSGQFNMGVEKIIEEMRKANQEQGWKVEIQKINIVEKEGVFEGNYKTPANIALRSKEKILIGKENKAYLIAFMALAKDWEKLEEVADFIISSAQLLTD